MTHRDFCYWLQGYFEIAQPSDTLTFGEWNTILEHLTLTINLVETESMGGFTRFVENLWGFIQINGRQIPGTDQVAQIKATTAGLFEKVTSNDGPNAAELLDMIRKRKRETETPQISPWDENTPICTSEPHGHKLCTSIKDDVYCCSASEVYPEQPSEALGRNPLK